MPYVFYSCEGSVRAGGHTKFAREDLVDDCELAASSERLRTPPERSVASIANFS
jgi:hypothetical protein